MNSIDRLRELYRARSKHSDYQRTAPALAPLLGDDCLPSVDRLEPERFLFLHRHLPLAGRSVIDIGANCGYFTLEALRAGATSVVAFEGNLEHAAFLGLAGELLAFGPRLTVRATYLDPRHATCNDHADVIFCLNVIHHLGDDFGVDATNVGHARHEMGRYIRSLTHLGSHLVLQLGFNWRGNRHLPLFEHGTKQEQIDFVSWLAGDDWAIRAIGIAHERESCAGLQYEPPASHNLGRRNDLGEFANRPIFLLENTSPPR